MAEASLCLSNDARAFVRVLFADDEPGIRTIVTMNLNAEGFDVTAVEDGDAVLEAVERVYPDLIVLDIMMPGHDGLEVLRALKACGETAGIPVVLLTAKASDDDVREGLRCGADIYMTKPFNPEELAYAAHHLIGTGELW
jgi:DNA-binding response OmpR family regulator